ncbi:3450_t:CDS:1, partial [Racocetra persica]
ATNVSDAGSNKSASKSLNKKHSSTICKNLSRGELRCCIALPFLRSSLWK